MESSVVTTEQYEELQKKYTYAIRSLQAISTRNPYTENYDVDCDWDNAGDSKAFHECKRCAKTALNNLGEDEHLPGYNGGYKARQERYEKKHKRNKEGVSLKQAINLMIDSRVAKAEKIFKEEFDPHVVCIYNLVGKVIISIEPLRNKTMQDVENDPDMKTLYCLACDFLKETIFTKEVQKKLNYIINKNYVDALDDATTRSKLFAEAQRMIDDEVHRYQNTIFVPLWSKAYEYYKMIMEKGKEYD